MSDAVERKDEAEPDDAEAPPEYAERAVNASTPAAGTAQSLPSALLVARGIAALGALPALGYATAYAYEWGQAIGLGYPRDLISIDLTAALTAGLSSAGLVYAIAMMFYVVFGGLGRHVPERVRLAAPILGFVATVSLLAGIVFEERLTWGIAYLALLTTIVSAGFFWARHLDDESRKMYAKTRPVAIVGMAVLLALLAAAVFGHADAKGKDTFLVLANKPSFVVVKVYGDRVIAKGLDMTSRCLTDDIEVFTFSNRSVRFIQKDLGRLSQC